MGMRRGIGGEDAIGKFHEAATVERLSRLFQESTDMSKVGYWIVKQKFFPLVRDVADDIEKVARPTVREMLSFIGSRLGTPTKNILVKSFSLASDSYRRNRLDSTDVVVEAGSGEGFQEFHFSLKAIRTEGVFPCVRNPGFKQLVKAPYFGCGNIDGEISAIREMFHRGQLDEEPRYRPTPDSTNRHSNALILSAEALYDQLRLASNESLIRGVTAIVGDITLIVANYGNQTARCESIPCIRPPFVISVAPTPINVSLKWNGHNILTIRSKFASGTTEKYLHRWSSLKAAVTLHVT